MSCSGGGGGGGGGGSGGVIIGACNNGTANGDALCLLSCNLGCNSAGCSITDIAQNQPLIFQFNQQLNPISVNNGSVSIRTATGDEPVGQLLVNGNQVEFIPDIQIVNGQSFFGFLPGEVYTLALIGGADDVNAIRSVSGDPLEADFTCTLNITQGIADLNGAPPSAQILSPTVLTAAPVDSVITIAFNELIDPAPFVGTSSLDGPVQFRVRQTRPNGQGGVECSPTAPPIPLDGTPQLSVDPTLGVTVINFSPLIPLPGDICVEILVTNRVVDFSGNQAREVQLRFVTESIPRQLAQIVETFEFPNLLDNVTSAGTWGTNPQTGQPEIGGFFGNLGGDGRHGSLDGDTLELIGTRVSDLGDIPVIYEISTENETIPATMALNGIASVVSDGVFQFTDVQIPQNTIVRFVGSRPAQILACGRIDIRGTLDARGGDAPTRAVPGGATTTPVTPPNDLANFGPDVTASSPLRIELVRDGGIGGPGGGVGGMGGAWTEGLVFDPNANGQAGSVGAIPAGYPFPAQSAATGGAGSPVFPTSGLVADISYTLNGIQISPGNVVFGFCVNPSGGAGGGGHDGPGGAGNTVFLGPAQPPGGPTASTVPPLPGPHGTGGGTLTLDPAQRPMGVGALDYYLVGGAGGGGSGTSSLRDTRIGFVLPNSTLDEPNFISAGAGGGGGGGAVALVAGDELLVDFTGNISVQGGAGSNVNLPGNDVRAPGPSGAGSGGSLVMLSGREFRQNGSLDVRGGNPGVLVTDPNNNASMPTHRIELEGGAGALGFLRVEYPGASTDGVSALGTVLPATDPRYIGDSAADEGSQFSSFQSNFYVANVLTPFYQRYILECDVDAGSGPVRVIYSDDPSVPNSVGPAARGLTPVFVQFQSVDVDPVTLQPRNPPTTPWRTVVGSGFGSTGIAEDGFNGLRFRCILDRNSGATVVVRNLQIDYEF